MKLKNIFISLLVTMLFACSTTAKTDKDFSIQEEKREEIHLEQKLISTAAEGGTETILELVESGADIDATDKHGVTAVMAATQKYNTETVKALIEQGADINIRNNNQDNVLLYAGAEGFLEIVKLAVEAGADATLTNRFGGTALIPASERGHIDVVEELLLNSDTDVNHINHLHWTALLEAVILGNGGENHQKIVQLLIDHGADIHIGDREGITPLEHAERLDYKEIERILKEFEA